MDIYKKLLNSSLRTPEKTAVIFHYRKINYRDLVGNVDNAASHLSHSFPNSRRIAVNAVNSIELIALAFAIAKLGWCMVPVNPALRKAQLIKQVKITCCDVLVCSDVSEELWRKEMPRIKTVGMSSLFVSRFSQDVNHIVKTGFEQEDDYLITLSSGSTGEPKPIVLTQTGKLRRSEQARGTYNICENDIILCASPFFHSLGQRLSFLPLFNSATLVLLEHFTVGNWLQAVSQYRVTFTIAVSSHLQALRESLFDESEKLQSLRCLVSSSALLSYELKENLIAKLGCHFHEMYGATEIATVTDLSPVDARFRPGSVGRALPGIDIRILDENGVEMEANNIGEIACRSGLRFKGYDAKPRETRACFKDGYFLTGDLGYVDTDGFLFFVSRKKDIIITGGINVVPKDIEVELLKLPDIVDCCVIGVDDHYLGEAILAVCVSSRHTQPNESLIDSIRLRLNGVLAGFQQPRGYEFVAAIPLTASGKPDKEQLREKYRFAVQEQRAHA